MLETKIIQLLQSANFFVLQFQYVTENNQSTTVVFVSRSIF